MERLALFVVLGVETIETLSGVKFKLNLEQVGLDVFHFEGYAGQIPILVNENTYKSIGSPEEDDVIEISVRKI